MSDRDFEDLLGGPSYDDLFPKKKSPRKNSQLGLPEDSLDFFDDIVRRNWTGEEIAKLKTASKAMSDEIEAIALVQAQPNHNSKTIWVINCLRRAIRVPLGEYWEPVE
ncbi:hypothetical protein A3J32_01905 [Candidatus Saccharibacteria bacterium RIFCSPLOWO2_02_FULL_46_7]|nr:MAG: hypothetical protein A3J32_01905 [Candidatus Saccharibacteria bacterium RIFCSPLOWO2_02_FULL_46_7]